MSIRADDGEILLSSSYLGKFEFYALPKVSFVVPSHGTSAGGSMISIYGSQFSSRGIQCRFGNQVVRPVYHVPESSSLVVCSSPKQKDVNVVDVEISSDDGLHFSNNGIEFVYGASPTVFSVQPCRSSSSGGGNLVTVLGLHFMPSKELSCRFGRTSMVRARFLTSSLVTCLTPLHDTATVMLEVSNNGVDRSHGSVKFVYSEFSLTSVFPQVGIASSSYSIILTFSPAVNASKIECVFDGDMPTVGIQTNLHEARCKVPDALSSGKSYVSMVMDGQSSMNAIAVYLLQMPEMNYISPSRGPDSGGTVLRIQAANLNEIGVFCRFGGKATVQCQYVSTSLATCISPAMPIGESFIELSPNGIDFSNKRAQFQFNSIPIVSKLMPSQISEGGRAHVLTVIGQHFTKSELFYCKFGQHATGLAHWLSYTMVWCTLPPSVAGNVTVEVSDNGVDYSKSGQQFFMASAPHIQNVYPTTLRPFMQFITITGHGFWNGLPLNCSYGSRSTLATFVDGNKMLCELPPSRDIASVEFYLDGKAYMGGQKNILDWVEMKLSQIQPSVGPTYGGSMVSVFGLGFDVSKDAFCQFGQALRHQAILLSSTLLHCKTPPSNPGQVQLNVHHDDEIPFEDGYLFFNYEEPPSIDYINPTMVSSAGGQIITLHGHNFIILPHLNASSDLETLLPLRIFRPQQ
jgi:hypothetical protein